MLSSSERDWPGVREVMLLDGDWMCTDRHGEEEQPHRNSPMISSLGFCLEPIFFPFLNSSGVLCPLSLKQLGPLYGLSSGPVWVGGINSP